MFGERHDGLVSLPYHKHVCEASSESVPEAVFNVDDVKRAVVAFTVRDDPHTPQIPAPCDHTQVPHIKFDDVSDLATGDVDAD